jgi:membrane-associated phospholipid phosphatase
VSRRPLVLLGLAAACASAALAVWAVAFVVPRGRLLDGRALETFTGVATARQPSIHGIAVLADPWPFGVAGAVLVVLALLRRRWLMAAVVPAILLSANLATQWLKPALAELRVVDLRGIDAHYAQSWPSGHSTAAMSLALCLVLVVGPALRPLAALVGAGYAIAVGYALVVLGFHLPSDVLGGYLVAATFTLLGAAALAALEARRPVGSPRTTRPPAPLSVPALAAFATLLVCCAAVAVVARAPGAPVNALQHPTAVLAGVVIAGLGLVLTSGLALALRR